MNGNGWYDDEAYWEAIAPVLYSEQERTANSEEIDGIIQLLGIKRGAAVLDLCCGPGRHSLELAKRGFRVTGVDLSAPYVRWARDQAERIGGIAEFVHADMRDFRRPERFDAAVNLSTSFGYFDDPEDDRRVVRNIHRSLKPGGMLLMDMLGKRILRRNEPIRDWKEAGDTLVLQERTLNEEETEVECREILIKRGDRREYRYSHRVYSAERLSSLLTECGFSVAGVYGDFDRNPYDRGADRLVVLAKA